MATLNETIKQVQDVFNNIESALQEQGVDTSNLKPIDYANAVRGIVNDITVENVSFLPVIIFTYSKNKPAKPIGGTWVRNDYTNSVTPPEGWYIDLDNAEDASVGTDSIYMSTCIFKQDGTKFMDWTTPTRISGKDGADGKPGKQGPAGNIAGVVQEYNTPIYTSTSATTAPNKPQCTFNIADKQLEINSEGWSHDTPGSDWNGTNIIWQSIARYYSDKSIVECSNPVRISAGNPDVITENGFYTEYCITDSLDGVKTDWFTPASADPPIPTVLNPFLWARDVMHTTATGKHTGPVYLFATYSAGLIGIDVDYTCCAERDELDTLDESRWFDDSSAALTPDINNDYHGLTEDTKYLWAREQFIYSNKEPDVHYRIISTFTAAEKAAIIYSAGPFNEKVKYTRTDEQTPYVFYADGVTLDNDNKYDENGKKYYYFVLKYSYDDDLYKVTPESNEYPSIKDLFIQATYSDKKCNWEKMESFEAIYSDIGVFGAANVGQFVFDDRYIFSQMGRDKSGKDVSYTEFSEYDSGILGSEVGRKGIALAIEMGEFIPNILLDAITGVAKFGGDSSVFNADGSAEMANGNIRWDNEGKVTIGNDNNIKFENGEITATGLKIKGSQDIEDLRNSIKSVQDQIDGVVENWNGEGAPTLANEPASNWKTDAERIAHINDTYINIEEYVDDETTPTAGHAWRWCKCTDASITDYVTVTDKDGNTFRLHWHKIADSDTVRALKEAAEATRLAAKAQSDINDMSYLKDTFAKGETNISGGIVMTQMVAVGDGGDNVEAFLNGSDFAEDTTHGKLILAGGIPDGTGSLESRVKTAKTRIYEDGLIDTSNLNLQDGCTIGDLKINTMIDRNADGTIKKIWGYIRAGDYVYLGGDKFVELSSDGLKTQARLNSGTVCTTQIGGHCDAYTLGIFVGATGYCAAHDKDVGIEIDAPDAYALFVKRGMFAGLRPNTRTVTADTELTEHDHTIMIDTTAVRTITLPTDPQIGQEYEFIMNNVTSTKTKHKIVTDSSCLIHVPASNVWGFASVNMDAYGVVKMYCTYDAAGTKRWWLYRLA